MRIRLVNLYFGKYPLWMPAYLASCSRNPDIEWLLFSDCDPGDLPPNVAHQPLTLDELNKRASSLTGIEVRKRAYTSVDLKPLYGLLFREELKGCDFWGHCDLDVIWGNLLQFFAPLLEKQDVVSSRKGEISGHLTFWKNTTEINQLPLESPELWPALSTPELTQFDEPIITRFLASRKEVRLYREQELVVDWRSLRRQRTGWHWQTGTLLNRDGEPRAYIHFGEWKRQIRHVHVHRHDVTAFWITRRGIWPSPPPPWEQFLARYPWDKRCADILSNSRKKLATLFGGRAPTRQP